MVATSFGYALSLGVSPSGAHDKRATQHQPLIATAVLVIANLQLAVNLVRERFHTAA
jgi:hypothetical protein